MLEPAAGVRAPLVAQASQEEPLALRVGRDHPALARRDLLVRVEREHGRRPVRADALALVTRAECLAGVVDERDPPRVAQGAKLVELTGVAVDVDRDDRARAVGERSLDRRRSEVQRSRVDVGEHRRRPFVDRAVGRRDEGVRRRDDLVAGSDSGCDAEQVEPRRAARNGGGVRGADRLGERLLETVDRRAEREAAGPEHLGDELGLPLVEPRARERDRPDGRHAKSYAAEGDISTTSSQWLQRSVRPSTVSRYACCSSRVTGPTPISRSSTARTGATSVAVPTMNTSSAR